MTGQPTGEPLRIEPCGYPARAYLGEVEVASSPSALRVEEAGRPPALYFPAEALRLDRLPPDGTGPRPGGRPASGAAAPPVVELAARSSGPRARLAGMATFDPGRVRLELLDTVPGEDPKAATVKRFPNWGDARDLVGLLDVDRSGPSTFTAAARADRRRPVVEGSQMLGQALVAAGRLAPGRRPVFASMVFLRAADAAVPLRLELEELSAGRTFTGLAASVSQDGRRRAAGTLLLDVTAPDVVRHEVPPPAVPGPYDCPPLDMGVTGRDVRVVDGAYDDDPSAPVGPPEIDAWVRFRTVPEDPALHVGLLAQFTGHMSIAAALRPHPGVGQRQAHRSLSTAVNAIALCVHRDVRVDRWLLYHHRSTFAGCGMTHSECRVHDEEGDLLASFTVDCMVRGFGDRAPLDEGTAL